MAYHFSGYSVCSSSSSSSATVWPDSEGKVVGLGRHPKRLSLARKEHLMSYLEDMKDDDLEEHDIGELLIMHSDLQILNEQAALFKVACIDWINDRISEIEAEIKARQEKIKREEIKRLEKEIEELISKEEKRKNAEKKLKALRGE